MKVLLAGIASVLLLTSLVGSVDANNVPDWVKNNAGWWAEGQIDDTAYAHINCVPFRSANHSFDSSLIDFNLNFFKIFDKCRAFFWILDNDSIP